VQWHSVVIHGLSAEYAAKIESGSLVFVEGEMSYRDYEREIDGIKVQWPVAEVIASSITATQTKEKAERGAAA
jgi:single-stranded DNA-binding protein